ncbi:MAG: stage II sporulation protein P [Bacillota bacterium]
MRPRSSQIAGLVLLIVFLAAGGLYYYRNIYTPPTPVLAASAGGADEAPKGQYFTVNDEAGNLVFTTGHMVHVGDEFISEEDVRYQVTEVSGTTAVAKSLGKMEALLSFPPAIGAEAKGAGNAAVAIYHTHSDESYEPSDGTDSIPAKGGVLQVGKSLASSLTEKGVKAIHSTTPHDPHDGGAYDRSRRTLMQLLKDRPAAVFDVHRDAGPAEPYLKDVPGSGTVAKGMIVIGRTNPKMNSNLDFARRLMNSVNSKYPGLVKGIFVGKADFNQDLYDRALLLEMGTEKTSREAAAKGVDLIGEVVPSLLGVTSGPGGGATGRSIGWILGLAVAGTFIYLWISTGSWDEMRAKIMGWFGSGGVKVGGGRKNGGPDAS